jgi:predicted lipid-binding transport protein (Tim44 family)
MRIITSFGLALLLAAVNSGLAWGRGGGGCLERGTLILTPSGPVPIERLRPGDLVWAVMDRRLVPSRVAGLFEVQPETYLELTAGGRKICVTPEHPFQIAAGVFRQADQLGPGDSVWLVEGQQVKPAPLQTVRRLVATTPAYNLLVMPGGTYVAGGFVVHNKGCFLPDTPILKADGSTVPIASLRPGDALRAFTPDGKTVQTTVRKILTHEVGEYVLVTTPSRILRVTIDHPFYVGAGSFRTLEGLREGDSIYAYDGEGLRPQRIVRLERIRARTRVYNLQTDAPHTFFANGIAVHNKGGGGGGGGHGGGGGFGFHGGSGGGIWHATTGSPASAKAIWTGAAIGGCLGFLGWLAFGKRRSPLGYALSTLGGGGLGALALTDVCDASWVILLVIFGASGLVQFFKKASKKDEDLDFVHSQVAVAAKADKTRRLLEFLAKQDASMAVDTLCETTRATFFELQKCWQARDYGPMQPLLMPDLYAQHVAQLRGMIRNHEINRLEDVHVEKVDIVNLRYTDKPDNREFTALITARARDYYVDDRNQHWLRGDRQPAQFQEFWTFHQQSNRWLLRDIEQSRESDKLGEENFVEFMTNHQLEQVYGGKADAGGPAGPWLEKDVARKATRIDRLLNYLVQTDKLWDQSAMKNRAREVFAHVMLAQEAGDLNAVRSDELFPDIATHLQQVIRQRHDQGLEMEFRNLCVRKVELVLVSNVANKADDEFTARISAHAQRVLRRHGSVVRQDEYVAPFEEYWTFGRLDGAWKLKQVLPPGKGREAVGQENVDEFSSAGQLQWYYQHSRAS